MNTVHNEKSTKKKEKNETHKKNPREKERENEKAFVEFRAIEKKSNGFGNFSKTAIKHSNFMEYHRQLDKVRKCI